MNACMISFYCTRSPLHLYADFKEILGNSSRLFSTSPFVYFPRRNLFPIDPPNLQLFLFNRAIGTNGTPCPSHWSKWLYRSPRLQRTSPERLLRPWHSPLPFQSRFLPRKIPRSHTF